MKFRYKTLSILILYSSFFIATAIAQDSLKLSRLSMGVWASTSTVDDGINIEPYFSYNIKKQTVFLGPIVGLGLFNNVGFITGYRIFPNPKGKHFDLFFEYNFEFAAHAKTTTFDCYNTNPNAEKSIYELNRRFDNTFCYGFKFRFLKIITFDLSTGFGFGFNKYRSETEYCDGSKKSFGNGKYNLEFPGFILKTGLSINFPKQKKIPWPQN